MCYILLVRLQMFYKIIYNKIYTNIIYIACLESYTIQGYSTYIIKIKLKKNLSLKKLNARRNVLRQNGYAEMSGSGNFIQHNHWILIKAPACNGIWIVKSIHLSLSCGRTNI